MTPKCNECGSSMFAAGGHLDGSVQFYKCSTCGSEINDIKHEVVQTKTGVAMSAPSANSRHNSMQKDVRAPDLKLSNLILSFASMQVHVIHTQEGHGPARGKRTRSSAGFSHS